MSHIINPSNDHSSSELVNIIQRAISDPPGIRHYTLNAVLVKKLNPKTGLILFEVEFRKGIRFGVINWEGSKDEFLAYAEGNIFLIPKNSVREITT